MRHLLPVSVAWLVLTRMVSLLDDRRLKNYPSGFQFLNVLYQIMGLLVRKRYARRLRRRKTSAYSYTTETSEVSQDASRWRWQSCHGGRQARRFLEVSVDSSSSTVSFPSLYGEGGMEGGGQRQT